MGGYFLQFLTSSKNREKRLEIKLLRKGKFGKFMGCTKYPKCDYTNNIVEARKEYKKSINEEVIDDIRRAYSTL